MTRGRRRSLRLPAAPTGGQGRITLPAGLPRVRARVFGGSDAHLPACQPAVARAARSVVSPPIGAFIVRRLLWAGFLFLSVTAVTYVIFCLVPSFDPPSVAGGSGSGPEYPARLRAFLGLDEPLWKHYG